MRGVLLPMLAAVPLCAAPLHPAAKTVPGPREGVPGYTSAEAVWAEVALPEPLGERGSVAFWFRLGQDYTARPGVAEVRQPLLECPGVFTLDFKASASQVELDWRWADPGLLVNRLRPILPRLPGSEWVHFAVSWDAAQGRFDGWLNGTPLREPGTRLPPWEHRAQLATLRVRLGPVAVAGVSISPEPLDEATLTAQVGAERIGSLRGLLGAREAAPADLAEGRGELLYMTDFVNLADWVAEGPLLVAQVKGGGVEMRSARPDDLPRGHTVLWLRKELPERFLAEWEFQPLGERGLCIVFFAARGRNGEGIFDPALQKREGEFPLYHSGDIDCYHISYYAHTPETPGRLTSNLRKNHGFHLVANGPPGVSAHGRGWHRVQLRKEGARIRLAVEGRQIIDFTDDGQTWGPTLGGGHFGLRQMVWTVAAYRALRIYELP